MAFPRKYSRGGIFRRVGDADVDDPLNTSFLGCVEESERIPYGIGVLEEGVVEAHPIGVVKDRHAPQMVYQQIRLIEMERKRLDAVVGGIASGQ